MSSRYADAASSPRESAAAYRPIRSPTPSASSAAADDHERIRRHASRDIRLRLDDDDQPRPGPGRRRNGLREQVRRGMHGDEDLEVGQIAKRERDVGGVERRWRVGRRVVVGGWRGQIVGKRLRRRHRPRIDSRIRWIGRLRGQRANRREPCRVAQGRDMPDAGLRERDQHRVAGRVVAGLRDQFDASPGGGRRDRDLGRQAIRRGLVDGPAQSKGPDDDDHAPKRSALERFGAGAGCTLLPSHQNRAMTLGVQGRYQYYRLPPHG